MPNDNRVQAEFIQRVPSLESYWRSVILFGRNVASYKFALGKSLLELANAEDAFISLDRLAEPFSRNLIEHIHGGRKQTTSNSSQYLDACRKSIRGEITQDELIGSTARLGFANVIDAFHVVNGGEIQTRFFQDERRGNRGAAKGIRLTDDLFRLKEGVQSVSLPHEIESRWNLVESAWDLKISRGLIKVRHDREEGLLFTQDNAHRRVDVTSSRSALNGYQKGKCFYCSRDIAVGEHVGDPAEVDHFFPHALQQHERSVSVNGVWNLVLACQGCNRGTGGKFARLPSRHLLERLSQRNEFLIASHHPLRETLMEQTGRGPFERHAFLQRMDDWAIGKLIHRWEPEDCAAPEF